MISLHIILRPIKGGEDGEIVKQTQLGLMTSDEGKISS